jgi:hypothetical protein
MKIELAKTAQTKEKLSQKNLKEEMNRKKKLITFFNRKERILNN